MKEKKEVYFRTNQEDIISIVALMVNKITARTQTRRSKLFETIRSKFADTEEILTGQTLVDLLSELTQVSAQEANELEDILPLISLMAVKEESRPEAQSASNTEVFKDLPDLKEDGLGIYSGRVESVSIPSDHPKK